MKDCNNCGKCCLKYSESGLGSITWDEMMRLPKHAQQIAMNGYLMENTIDIWIDAEGEELKVCPWLFKLGDKHYCTIYESRPDICRTYPVSVEQMQADGCEMLEDCDAAS